MTACFLEYTRDSLLPVFIQGYQGADGVFKQPKCVNRFCLHFTHVICSVHGVRSNCYDIVYYIIIFVMNFVSENDVFQC